MSDEQQLNSNSLNPYQSPQSVSTDSSLSAEIVELPAGQKLADQSIALGAFWVLVGTVVLAIGFLVEAEPIFQLGCSMLGAIWIFIGVACGARKRWSYYVGLILSYLAILAVSIGLNPCGSVLFVLAVLQGHRLIKWSSKSH